MNTAAESPLRDAAAREEFITALDENFCVSAGAGVGKTRAITERIAALAGRRAQEPDIFSRLVVVTYGRLAAEELRVRTRERLLTRLGDSTAFGRQQLLGDLRGAFFGTIHSFCLKLIAEHGRFLGLPAAPELLEGRALQTLWTKFCDSEQLLSLSLPADLLRRVERHLTFEQLLALARELDPAEIEPLLEAGTLLAPDVSPAPDFAAALADAGGKNAKGRVSTAANQERLRRWLDEWQAADANSAAANASRFLKLPEFKTGSQTFKTAFADGLRPYARWLNAAAGRLAALLAQAWRNYRLEHGAMTYRDQIFWARRLLNRPATLRALRERRYLVILDEAQDTDAEMFAVLSEIARPLDAPLGNWPREADAPGPLPGHFSFVGDEQQAIYRERADPEIYAQYVRAFREGRGGRRLEFSVTMRCPTRVLSVVNALFADGRLPQPHVEFRALHPRPACPDGGAWLLPLDEISDTEDERANTAERVARECAQVADFLLARGKGGLGVARWDEVAVIAPRIAWLEAAAAACGERGLPVSLISQNRLARELPVFSWPAALLHVLVNPWDRFELIGVLREIFAVSDVELARLHRRAEGGLAFWPQLPAAALAGAPKRLRDALTLLHELRAVLPGELEAVEVRMTTLARFVEHLLERTALAARLEVIGCEDARVALDWLRREALQAECDGWPLRAWVRRLVEALDAPPPTLGAAAESIQLLTCQKAKGLEWPVVIPLGFGCAIHERTPDYPRLERELGAVAQIHFSALTLEKNLADTREQRRREELQRFLYVTLTRARQLLIVPDGSRLHGEAETSLQSLAHWPELAGNGALGALLTPAAQALFFNDAAGLPGPAESAPPAWFSSDEKLTAQAAEISQRIPQRILPSSLAHGAATDAAAPETVPVFDDDDLQRLLAADAAALEDTDAMSDEASQALAAVADHRGGALLFPPRALLGGRGGKDYGNWWHATLESYPWTHGAASARTEYLAGRLATIPAGEPELSERARFEVARFAESRAHAEFLHAGNVFLPEAPFSYPRNAGEWLEGILDLAVLTHSGEVWIVDWKTDRRRQDETEAQLLARLAEKYGPQLRAYAEVFERGLGRRVSRLLLYSTPLGQTAEL
ncbi:MAG: UvrD-helicase domain-containing protein [Verrucomicrobia bacterium]|nr:UvrD-helicase domain-containing protein [Verrucomicrobiota bacterium]